MTSLLFDKQGGGTLEQRILRHIERYRITTPHVVGRLFFSDDQSIEQQERLQQAYAILQGFVAEGTITTLSKATKRKKKSSVETAEATVPKHWTFESSVYVLRGHKIKAGEDLARLWYCCMLPQRSYYAEYKEVMSLFAADGIHEKQGPHQNCFHVFADEEGSTVLYRLYVCRAARKNAAQQIKNFLAPRNAKHYQHWIEQGAYGMAILVESEQKKKEIEGLLQDSYAGAPRLDDRARFTVSVIPTEANYEQSIAHFAREVWL